MGLLAHNNRWYYYALSIGSLAGTIIGVGMFSLPYVALKAGFFLTTFYLVFFGIIIAVTHLAYTEVTLRTKYNHRFPGYVGQYLGKRWKTVVFIEGLISIWGSLLVYTIVAAKFLYLVLLPVAKPLGLIITETQLGVIFFLISIIIIWRGDFFIGKQEFLFTLPIVFIIIFIFFASLSSPSFSFSWLYEGDRSKWVMPYGVTLFALAGFSALPMLEHILKPAQARGMKFNYPFIVLTGTLLPALLYIIFTLGVLGISGDATSEDALSGLNKTLGSGIVGAGALLALLAIYTSFISVGNELQKTFSEDFHFTRKKSILFTASIPLLLYLLNLRDFITITNFIGAVMGGFIGLFVILLLWKAQKIGNVLPPFTLRISKPLGFFIIALFTFTSLYAIFDIISSFILTAFSK